MASSPSNASDGMDWIDMELSDKVYNGPGKKGGDQGLRVSVKCPAEPL